MNILLLGSGGREDALAWRLRQSPSCDELVAAPGNPGIARWAECVAIDPCDPAAVVDAGARARRSTWSSSAPKRRWSPGSPMRCARPASRCSGRAPPRPSSKARRASPRICARAHGIPTADYVRVETEAEALAALDRFAIPVVIKADGLAAGKGVTVAMTRDEAEAAIARRRRRADGDRGISRGRGSEPVRAGRRRDARSLLASAQDHKRVGEGDTGPNTGGMGAYSPAPVLTAELEARAMARDRRGRPRGRWPRPGRRSRGVLYRRADADRRRAQADRI